MSSTNIVKVLLILFVLFAAGEIIFFFQKYGKNVFNSRPKSGSCRIFEDQYCKLGKRVEYPLNGKSYTFIGINLPSGIKTPIFAGADGKVATGPEQGNPFNGTLLQIKTATGEFYDIRGNINVILTNPTVKSGDQMGYAQATTAKSLGYDVVFTITTASPNGTIVEEDKLKQLFKLK